MNPHQGEGEERPFPRSSPRGKGGKANILASERVGGESPGELCLAVVTGLVGSLWVHSEVRNFLSGDPSLGSHVLREKAQ